MRLRFLTLTDVAVAAQSSGIPKDRIKTLCELLITREVEAQCSMITQRMYASADREIDSALLMATPGPVPKVVPGSRINPRESDTD